MKLLASILSCLILTLSAGANGTVLTPRESGAREEVRQAGGCGCCCQCGDAEDVPDTAADEPEDSSPHKGCPFCISNTCPGFAPAFGLHICVSPADMDVQECLFVQHRYVSPTVNGIWQPPRTA